MKKDKKVKVGDTEVALEELLKNEDITSLLESVRKEEKDKLYPSIEELKTTLKAKEEELRQAGNASTLEKEKLLAEIKALREPDPEKLTEIEKLQKELKDSKKAGTAETKKLQERLQNLERENAANKLLAYREQKIRELESKGEGFIEALVRGTSEKDIDISIEIAKKEYQLVVERLNKSKEEEAAGTPTGTVTIPTGTGGKVEYTAEQIAKMSGEDWEKVHEKVIGSFWGEQKETLYPGRPSGE